jgi:hypothetical protein
VPPEPRENPADKIGYDIPRVTDCSSHNVWADDLEKYGPYDEMKGDLTGGWRRQSFSQTEPVLCQENWRERARDQQRIAKMIVQEPIREVRFQDPTVERIKTARYEE